MALAKMKSWLVDRRSFLQASGALGVGAVMMSPEQLFAQEMCEDLSKSTPDPVNPETQQRTLQYWIDGVFFSSGRSNLLARANVACFMDLNQTVGEFVEAVALLDSNNNTLAARWFDASMKTLAGKVPYVIFDNLLLVYGASYKVAYTVRKGSNLILYTASFNAEPTRLSTSFMPPAVRRDFTSFLVGNEQRQIHQGQVTTPFQFYTRNGLGTHSARGRVREIGSDGSFSVDIDFMHGDAGAYHYMRYFIVMDPVGRFLGLVRRSGSGDPNFPQGGSDQVARVGKISQADQSTFQFGFTTTEQATAPNAVPDPAKLVFQIGDIRDCPYVQVYTEDVYDALAKTTIRLR
jgi:hypothetical protein